METTPFESGRLDPEAGFRATIFSGDIRRFVTAYSRPGSVAGRFATAARLDQRRAIKRDALASIVEVVADETIPLNADSPMRKSGSSTGSCVTAELTNHGALTSCGG